MSAYTEALKASVKSQTEFQPKLMASAIISNVRTDDIFTNVLIQHGRKALNKEVMGSTRSDQLRYFGKVSGTPVKHCEDIFIGPVNNESNPKRILLTGKAGIGKTLFCQKLVRDWADDKLFQSQSHFKFVYLLTFRQLNLLENDQLSLQELLNCSTVLDDNSNIDESLLEYIVNHPEEVLIIIDGYDEYSQQDYITGESEKRYQNTAKEKMPVAALCTKLIKGKLLRDSVVMITSRPDESDKMGGICFDLYVEIAGFSPQQVQEFIKKYFRENDTMKNTVLDHVMKNENLVSFAHIPILCFLMCFSMEYALQTSESTDELLVSTTDIYSEVMNIFELKHNAASEYRTKEIPEKFSASHLVERPLDKLSELAGELLLQKKPIFEERDLQEKFRAVEIEKLKGSGLLHCGPPFRKSAFETTKYLSFTHMTLHEFLAARWFVMTNVIPNNVSEMVLQFIAGILSKKKNGKLMENLLRSISFSSSSDRLLLRAKCLSEYQDKEFAKSVIKNHPDHYSQDGGLLFVNLNDVDCVAISFLLDVFSALNEEEATTAQHQRSEQSFTINSLKIRNASLTLSGVKRIVEILEKESCSVTILTFSSVTFMKCVDCISGLVCSKLKELCMIFCGITDNDVTSLCDALKHPSSKVTTLDLTDDQISDTTVTSLCNALKHPSCKVTTLNLSSNRINDTRVTSLCDALKHLNCKVTTLDLSYDQITDIDVTSLCNALKHPSCEVTTLNLACNQITDTGVTSLRDALKHPSCKLTTLDLRGNQITDTGVTSLCDALKHPRCKLTTLDLTDNQITDTGVTSLCDALKHLSFKLTTLWLSGNQITDTGVTSLCEAVQHDNCKLIELHLICNPGINGESKQSVRNLVKQNRPGFKLVT